MTNETTTRTYETEARELAGAAIKLIKRIESIDRLLLERSKSDRAALTGQGSTPLIEVVETQRALDRLEEALLAEPGSPDDVGCQESDCHDPMCDGDCS